MLFQILFKIIDIMSFMKKIGFVSRSSVSRFYIHSCWFQLDFFVDD